MFVLGLGAGIVGLIGTWTAPNYIRVLAQNRKNYSRVAPDDGHIQLGLALRKLSVSGTFLQAPAHPDDETNALFTYFGYGMGLRVIDLQNNRGDSGQNEIGPELFNDLAVLRTAELLSAHRIDGAEQYFTRALQFHYSFSPEETIEKWGRKDIVGDYVRLWRMFRPDVIVTMNIQGRGGDRAHEAQTILVRESFRLAADPSMYPGQLKEGLRLWQPKKLYYAGAEVLPGGARAPGADSAKLTPVGTGMFDPLLGRTYAEIGADAHSNHKCQGVGGAPAIAGLDGAGRGGGGGRGGRGERYKQNQHQCRPAQKMARRRVGPQQVAAERPGHRGDRHTDPQSIQHAGQSCANYKFYGHHFASPATILRMRDSSLASRSSSSSRLSTSNSGE